VLSKLVDLHLVAGLARPASGRRPPCGYAREHGAALLIHGKDVATGRNRNAGPATTLCYSRILRP
jgi:hypothetical protein